jgi:inosose dehydratase
MSSERVLAEMSELGLKATEFGPDGFLPDDPQAKAATLERFGLAAVGGFVPLVLHDSATDPLPAADRALDGLAAANAEVIVLAAVSGTNGYDQAPQLDDEAWSCLLANLDRLAERGRGRGVDACLHPHVGTVIETPAEVNRVLDGSRIPLCLDTGHLLIGGTDPAELARDVPQRITHTHLKDVDASWADKVRAGEVSYTEAVRQGMYRPLGQGDVDIAAIVASLQGGGYPGWYVMEQDTVLDAAPTGRGPAHDVEASIAYLRGLA